MKLEVNITKSSVFTVLAAIVLFAGLFFSYAYNYNQPIPNPGHGADTVWVNVSGTEETLQDALDKKHIITSAPIDKQFCNTYTTGVGEMTWIIINLTLDKRNMCEDDNGCTYRIWQTTATIPEGNDFYSSYPVMFRQVKINDGSPQGIHKWLDAFGNQRGVNGDITAAALFTNWASSPGGNLYDDYANNLCPSSTCGVNGNCGIPCENGHDGLLFRDASDVRGYLVTICDY